MSCRKLLQSHLPRHFHYLIEISLVLICMIAVCPVSCCWPKFQSIHLILAIHCNRRRETLSMPKYSSPLLTRSSFKRFLYCGSKVLGVVVLCWSEKPHVGFPPGLSEDFLPRYRFCRHPLPRPTMLPFFRRTLFAYFKSLIKISKGFKKWNCRNCFGKTGLNKSFSFY